MIRNNTYIRTLDLYISNFIFELRYDFLHHADRKEVWQIERSILVLGYIDIYKVCNRYNAQILYFVFAIYRLESIEPSQFLSLSPHTCRGIIGLETRI